MIGTTFDHVLAAAAGGDERAFALLWRELQPGLLRYLRVIAPAAAEDLASETWLDVIRSLHRFQGDEQRFRSWTFTIARHRASDHRRRAVRRPAEPLPAERLPERVAADDPAADAMDHIATHQTLALIAKLSPDQAEVIALRVVAGLGVDEVARIVGKRPGAVRVLAHRGLRRLAQRLRAAPANPSANGADRPAPARPGPGSSQGPNPAAPGPRQGPAPAPGPQHPRRAPRV